MSAHDDLSDAELVAELERLNAQNDRAEIELIGLARLKHDALVASLKRAGVNVDGLKPPTYPTPTERRAREAARWARIPVRHRRAALAERGVYVPPTATRPQPGAPTTLYRTWDSTTVTLK